MASPEGKSIHNFVNPEWGALEPVSPKAKFQDVLLNYPEQAALNKVNIILGNSSNLQSLTPQDIQKIDRLGKVEQEAFFEAFYILLRSKNYSNSYIEGLSKLSKNSKIFFLDRLGWTNGLRSGSSFGDRIKLKDTLLSKADQRDWLKQLITSTCSHGLETKHKNGLRSDIEKYFIVSEIVSGFGYDWKTVNQKFKYHAQTERVKYPKDYVTGPSPEETVTRFFLNRMLDMGQKYNSLEEKKIIDQDKLQIIWKFAENSDGHILGIINGLSILTDDQQRQLNTLTPENLKRFLEKITNDERIEEKSSEFERGYNVGVRPSHEIAMLLDSDIIDQDYFAHSSEQVIYLAKHTTHVPEIHNGVDVAVDASVLCVRAKDELANSCFLQVHEECESHDHEDKEEDHLEHDHDELNEPSAQGDQFISFLEKEGIAKTEFDAFSEIQKHNIFDTYWKILSEDKQSEAIKVALPEVLRSVVAEVVKNTPAGERDSTPIQRIEPRVFQSFGVQTTQPVQGDVLQSMQPKSVQSFFDQQAKQIAALNVLKKGCVQKTALSFDQQQQEIKKIDTQNEEVHLKMYQSAQKNGFIEELTQSWGRDYSRRIQRRYAERENYVLANDYKDTVSSQKIDEVGSHIEEEPDFLSYLENNAIGRSQLQGSLSDTSYKDILQGFSKSDKQGLKNLNFPSVIDTFLDKKSPALQEKKLLGTVNNQIKKYFVKRVTYFLSNILDVDLDKNQGENIADVISLDENVVSNNMVTLQGTYQGKKLTFTYNIKTGELATGEWLHVENDSPVAEVGKHMQKLSTVVGPTFDEYFGQIKDVDYSEILKDSKGDKKAFKKGLKEQFVLHCPVLKQPSSFKEEMEKKSLKNILAQEIFELMGARSDSKDESRLFSLLAKSFTTYTLSQLSQMRGVVKYLADFEKDPNVSKKLLLLEKHVDHDHCDTSLELYQLTSLLFGEKRNALAKGQFADKAFFGFFSSFLNDTSSGNEPTIDVEKLLTYQEDLSGLEVTAYNKEYNMRTLQSNLESSIASREFQEKLTTI